jgi:hypothetical protein
MSFILALFQRLSDAFESPFLPMDSDYSYQARYRESERVRRARGSLFYLLD